MGLTNKLCNPTQFKQSFHYGAGTIIVIEPFSSHELHYSQMEDFVPSKPGWPAIREDLDLKGLFILDPDRPYDNQAYDAVKRSRQIKEGRFREGKEELRNGIIRQGIQFSEQNLNERLERAGYMRLMKECQALAEQEEYYEKLIKAEEVKTNRQFTLDPKRTVFILDPPREFPSENAMNYFLSRPENKVIKEKHEEFWERSGTLVASEKVKKKAANEQ